MGVARKRLTVVIALLLVCAQASLARESDASIGDVTFTSDEVLLALQENEVHPRLTVDLGDGEDYVFLVDTGATVNVIDTSIATSLGYEVVGETEIGAPGGAQLPATIVSVPVAKIGATTVTDAEFVAMDLLGFSGGRMHGVLGARMFSEYLLTFDRGAGHVKLSRGSLVPGQAGVVPYSAKNSQFEIDISVAGVPVAAHIDTGSMAEFTLPGELLTSLPVQASESTIKARLVGGERDIRFAQLQGNVEFAGLSFDNPNIGFMTPSPGSGNIGSGILADFIVSIDQKNHLIAFQKPAPGGVAALANKPRRLGVQFKGMPSGSELTVAAVMSGSLGEKAGLQSSDVMTGVNGKAMDQYDMAALAALFGGNDALRIDIRRDGQAMSIEIP